MKYSSINFKVNEYEGKNEGTDCKTTVKSDYLTVNDAKSDAKNGAITGAINNSKVLFMLAYIKDFQ